jgi:hypothetical protein
LLLPRVLSPYRRAQKRGCRPRRPKSRHSRSGVPGCDGSGRPDVLQGYDVAPDLRGGLHFGPLVAGEIGGFKRHLGDAMNTATRIAQAWRHTGCPLLVSKPLLDPARRCRQQHWRPTPGWQRGAFWSCSRSSASGWFARRLRPISGGISEARVARTRLAAARTYQAAPRFVGLSPAPWRRSKPQR